MTRIFTLVAILFSFCGFSQSADDLADVADFEKLSKKDQWEWVEMKVANDDGEIRNLIEEGKIMVDFRAPSGKTSLLDLALENNNYDFGKYLVDNGYDLNKRYFDDNGETSLHRMIALKEPQEGYEELLMAMLNNGADPDLRDLKTLTPIHYAIKLKNERAFNTLMSEEASFNDKIGSLQDLNYLQYFDKFWRKNTEGRQKLIDKTGLVIPGQKKSDKSKKDKKSKKSKKEETEEVEG